MGLLSFLMQTMGVAQRLDRHGDVARMLPASFVTGFSVQNFAEDIRTVLCSTMVHMYNCLGSFAS